MTTQRLVISAGNDVLAQIPSYSQRRYTPYGRSAGAGIGFNGELHESSTEIQLLGSGYRGYNCILMRFISPDNWAPFTPGALNPYGYTPDPINYFDPSGHVSLYRWFRELLGSKSSYIDTHSSHPDTIMKFYNDSATWLEPDGTFNIEAHGRVDRRYIKLDGQGLTAPALANFVKSQNATASRGREIRRIRLLSCGLGKQPSAAEPSFASELHQQLKLPVMAALGVIEPSGPAHYRQHHAGSEDFYKTWAKHDRSKKHTLGRRIKWVYFGSWGEP